MTDLCLSTTNLCCARGDQVLFRGLSLAVHAGEVLQLEGYNGSGKTTLLRALAGLTLPVDGEVLWCGQPIDEVRQDYHTMLAYEGHTQGLKGELSPLENLRFASRLLGGQPGLDVEAALVAVGLADRADVPCRHLSQGQRRRTALARLLVVRCPVWILDEPFTALDVAGRAMVEHLIDEHTAAGGLAVLATHHALHLQHARLRILELGR